MLLHFNSFMNPRLTIVPLLLWRLGFWRGASILLAPRGEFGKGALGRRSLKKRVYISCFRLVRLHRATIWHSTAPHETEDIRRMWGENAVIVEREENALLPREAVAPEVVGGPLRAVFLGRIVEHKGLAIALEALKTVEAPVHLDVYGTREDGVYADRCESLAASLPAHIRVRFRGAVQPGDVVGVLSSYDLLLMPTAGENFGHVIAEALSASCAVVTTADTPWTERLRAGGGVILDRSPAAWAGAIQMLATEPLERRLARRQAAGHVYEGWVGRPQQPHVWKLAFEALTSNPLAGLNPQPRDVE
ncbi:hypothetical protein B4U78_010580 [Microbacterium esteraromaticum]|nr:hypothetical protein B4U78_010580 [Microbacterium esteraromaticum]